MKTIYKYPLEIRDSFTLEMPEGAEVLTLQLQEGKPYIWVLVDPTADRIPYTFYMFATGRIEEEKKLNKKNYVGSYQLANGRLVFHLFREELN